MLIDYAVKEPVLRFIGKGWARLDKPLKTRFGVVPYDFLTDGFTLFWFIRWFHNPFGLGLVAAIWHDYALKQGNPKAHVQFYALLRYAGMKRWKAKVMYHFVRIYAVYKRFINKVKWWCRSVVDTINIFINK